MNASDVGSAERVYWTFNYLGRDGVSILDGGFRGRWEDGERPVACGLSTPEPVTFTAAVRSEPLIETAEVESVVSYCNTEHWAWTTELMLSDQ